MEEKFLGNYDGPIPGAAKNAVRSSGASIEGAEYVGARFEQVEKAIVQLQELLEVVEESDRTYSEQIDRVTEVLRTAAPDDPARANLQNHLDELLPVLERLKNDHAQVKKNIRDMLAIPLPGQEYPCDPTRLQ